MEQLIRERQQYLDQLVKREPSPFVNRVIYDHEGQLAIKVLKSYGEAVIEDPRFLEKYIMFTEPEFRGQFSREYFERHLKLPEWRRKAAKKIGDDLAGVFRELFEQGTHVAAITLQNPLDFGERKLSDVYFLSRGFQPLPTLGTNNGPVEIPLEESVRTLLRHEYRHAEQRYGGINLTEGLVIDSSNHYKILHIVMQFVEEKDACLKLVEDTIPLGKDNIQFLAAFSLWLRYGIDLDEIIEQSEFTPFEERLVNFLKDRERRSIRAEIVPF